MSNYYYDGSFDGLLTVIYVAYNDRESKMLRVNAKAEQLILALDDIHVITDFSKARRVERSICEKLSYNFFNSIRTCFLSNDKNKDTVIIHTVYKALKYGEEILNSLDEHAFYMNKLVKQVLNERHKYLGLLRFKEMKDGTMFSTIEPKNNVLPILISHFKNRMKKEKFAIFDRRRKTIVYYDGKKAEIFFVESLEIEWSDEEIEYSELWKTFHKSISIKERENKKLQQSNIPKYYWKHLIEDM
ncbi:MULTISPECIES: TIGR03915 family putative DNA repair protein [Fusobacterium]|uniref:TIGR03915 family putative DNA repair protein n=1 Tax=Fusobacterium TaxID=848 RepID=UPI0022E5ED77|nr:MULTISPECIES: TIGR03915 family putative DNA repair protein [Fusobacterium]